MRLPVLGTVYTNGCEACGKAVEHNALTQFVHDCRCWGLQTAVYNLRIRLFPPEWF